MEPDPYKLLSVTFRRWNGDWSKKTTKKSRCCYFTWTRKPFKKTKKKKKVIQREDSPPKLTRQTDRTSTEIKLLKSIHDSLAGIETESLFTSFLGIKYEQPQIITLTKSGKDPLRSICNRGDQNKQSWELAEALSPRRLASCANVEARKSSITSPNPRAPPLYQRFKRCEVIS